MQGHARGKFSKWTIQMGTLVGGNHFIEVCLDEASQQSDLTEILHTLKQVVCVRG